MTSSPCSPTRLVPSGAKASTAAPEVAAGDLAAAHRHQRAAAHEGRAHVGAAADRRHHHARPDPLAHPVEALGRQRGAGRPDRPQGRQVEGGVGSGREAGLAAGHEEGGRRAEERHALLRRQPPQAGEVGMAGVAVEQHQRGSDQQAADQVVPHHPAGGGEPQEPVARPQVVVQAQHLVVLERDAAVAVHDRLGQAGGPRREQHVERVVERDRLGRGAVAGLGQQVGPAPGRLRRSRRPGRGRRRAP